MRQFPDGWNNPHLWLLAFCGGVVSLRFFPQLPSPSLIAAAILTSLLLLSRAHRWAWLRPLAGFAVGFCWAAIFATVVSATTFPLDLEKKNVVVSGRVIGAPVAAAASGYQRFDFEVEQLEWQGIARPTPGKIRLKLYQAQPQILSGQKWRFTVRLKQARGYRNPGALFNYETYLFHHRIRATGYVRTKPIPLLLKSQNPASISAFRQRVAGFIRAALNGGERAGIVTALVVGIRSDMTARDWEVLVRTGTIHLVAISGLHVGLVSGLVLLLGSCCWRFAGPLPLYMPAPKVGVVVGLLAGIVYALLAGMTIPTQRAVCMLAVVAAAMFFQRRPFGFETLVMALTAVLAVDPLAPLSGGLWLSFGAVVILVLGVARTRARHSSPTQPVFYKRIARQLAAWSAIQMVLFIGMAPLLLVLFHRVSLVAPLANLVAIPVIGMLTVPLALLGLLLYSIGLTQAATLAFQSAQWIINQLWLPLEWLSSTAWSVWQQSSPPLWSLPFAAVGVLLLLAPRVFPARWSGLLWMLPLFAPNPVVPAIGEFRYTMLEVGHGLASVVQTRNHLLVYDAGPRFASGFDTGEIVVVPFLRQVGVDAIDILIISHGDNDHFGGHSAVRAQFPTARILTSVPEKIPSSEKCHAGQSWNWDEVRFEMLSPPRHRTGVTGNDASCVLKISSEFGALLLTGDIGKATEAALARAQFDLAADVLQTPHHGSKTSSTEAFLNRVRPAVSLASIGYLNRYGHPHKSVSARYARRQIPVYNTADEGAISVYFSAAGIALHGQRGVHRKYWLQPARHLGAPVCINARRTAAEPPRPP